MANRRKTYGDIYEEQYRRWIYKIKENDPLLTEKKEAFECAVFLCYSDDVLENILYAKTDVEIGRILYNARCA